MNFIETDLAGVMIIEPKVHADARGYFFESFRHDSFHQKIGAISFVQDNESKSGYGVLRGLHYQLPPFAQSKLVRVIEGEILDVAVDIRKSSPNYGKHISVALSAENKRQLFVPAGFAHGFAVTSQTAIVQYKVDNYYSKECDRGIRFDDPALKISWPDFKSSLQLSDKDASLPLLKDAEAFL